MTEAEVYRHRGTAASVVQFDRVTLRFAQGNEWRHASWEFILNGSKASIPGVEIEELATRSNRFDIDVIDSKGRRSGPFEIEAISTDYPPHCFCFLFSQDDDGMWAGHTVSRSFGELVVIPYRFDPS
jgi:hypothetical protein